MTTTERTVCEVPQQAVQQAPCITFGQFRAVAQQREWSEAWLVEQCRGQLEEPTATIRRVLSGALVDGRRVSLAEVVLPYTCLIALYNEAIHPKPALVGEKACACGCGAKVVGRGKWAAPGCRKRVQRRSQTLPKVAI
jgi:hypothetical protein